MEDPAVTRAKQLWAEKRPGDAVRVLVARIEELTQFPAVDDILPGSGNGAGDTFQYALQRFSQANWEVRQQTLDTLQVAKHQGVHWLSGLLLSFFLSFLGVIIVATQPRYTKPRVVTISRTAGGLTLTAGRFTGPATPDTIDRFAVSTRDGVPLAACFLAALVSSIAYLLLQAG
ncbi:MAG TPA: hypothetical protein PKD09_17090 [Aggregatilinea sp.]|uniref:hypothetical protein n=1 Tax=Aggregatilinea sp. TaxID=2806333 RepID=UPI002BC889B2|nr:hypothetical protein [Aggregatilinea sp.]HML23374.1 hypothetical protein [Aggregatilinea sp.]